MPPSLRARLRPLRRKKNKTILKSDESCISNPRFRNFGFEMQDLPDFKISRLPRVIVMRPVNDVLEILILTPSRFFQFVICEWYRPSTDRPRFGQHRGII